MKPTDVRLLAIVAGIIVGSMIGAWYAERERLRFEAFRKAFDAPTVPDPIIEREPAADGH